MFFRFVLQSIFLSLIFTALSAGNVPKIVDHSKGVYMHDHSDFPSVVGGPGGPYRTHYLHSQFGIGHRRRRAIKLQDTMLRMFNIRPKKSKEEK
ncbi:uncharacterized protein LOC144655211 [Oculina patagonica]